MRAIVVDKKEEILYTGSVSGAKKAIKNNKSLFANAHKVMWQHHRNKPIKGSYMVRTGVVSHKGKSGKPTTRNWVRFYQPNDVVYNPANKEIVNRADAPMNLMARNIQRNQK